MISDYVAKDSSLPFTDGIGIISREFIKEITEKYLKDYLPNPNYVPSALQIRFAGIKGVVAAHKAEKKLLFRPRYLISVHDSIFVA